MRRGLPGQKDDADICCFTHCDGKECGSDGCGGFCGECAQTEMCAGEGLCVCVPNCTDKECGDDGCGDPCGACNPGTICVFGDCQEGCDTDGDCAFLEECVGGYCQPDVPDDATIVGATLVETVPGQATPFVFGDVIEAGLTPAAGQGPGLMAQVGYGPTQFDPQANPQQWQWFATVYAGDAGDADRYKAELSETAPGTWAWTFRFSLDGIHWVYTDSTGLADGYSPTALGSWNVLPPPEVTGVVPDRGTVLGGTTVFIQGANFVDGLTLTLDGAPLIPASVSSDVIQTIPESWNPDNHAEVDAVATFKLF